MKSIGKKMLTWVLSMLLLAECWLTMGLPKMMVSAETSGDFGYSLLKDGTIDIDRYVGLATELSIPSTLDGRTVTSINVMEGSPFYGCNTLTSIIIPKTITSIGASTFASSGSVSLTNLVEILVDENNPSYCSKEGVLFSKDMSTLIAYPLGKKDNSYVIPDYVTSIEDDAFCGCTYLTEIVIPDSVTTIVGTPFDGCDNLVSIQVSENNSMVSSYDGVLFNKDKSKLISYPDKDSVYTVPNSTIYIEDGAFLGCTDLIEVAVTDNITSIGEYAFAGCTNLTNITISNSVANIRTGAFQGCTSLRNIDLPDGLTTINGIFTDCTGLVSIGIPESVISISYNVFDGSASLTGNGCENLTDVYYSGTEEQWNQIEILDGNDNLLNATIHYNSILPASEEVSDGTISGEENATVSASSDESSSAPFVPIFVTVGAVVLAGIAVTVILMMRRRKG